MDYKEEKQILTKWLTKPDNNFCAMPFIHMAIEADGDIRPCCMGDKFPGLNIRNKTIQEVYRDPIRDEFIESFKQNKQHKLCGACWKDPQIRTHFSSSPTAFNFTKDVMNGIAPTVSLKWLEIKPGNRCNLKCRICGVHGSSTWTKDEHKMSEKHIPYKESNAFKYTQSCDWIEDKDFWNDIRGLESVEYLHFMGGEPFMVPEHFQLLERLVEDPSIDTSTIAIVYNTNGTYFPTEENINLYNKFKKVHFALSIDDFGARFEYQRKLAIWEEVKNNIINFKKLYYENEQFTSNLDTTVSVLNIFGLDEIYEEFVKLGYTFDDGHEHYVYTGPDAIWQLPSDVKRIILDKYKGNTTPWIKKAMKYMMSQEPEAGKWMFADVHTSLDKIRKENFKTIYPEWYQILKPYWNPMERLDE
jgi:radical SAM protein with 4Fe4S-binding SPASM domain